MENVGLRNISIEINKVSLFSCRAAFGIFIGTDFYVHNLPCSKVIIIEGFEGLNLGQRPSGGIRSRGHIEKWLKNSQRV